MASELDRRRRRWSSSAGTLQWSADERAYAALLDALTRDRLTAEAAEVERQATARRSMASVQEEQDRSAREELAEARQELQAFKSALDDARVRGGSDGRDEVPYDSAFAEQDAHVETLIQYLVRPGYAEVRTEEPAPGHYVYYLRVDWERVRQLAEETGHPISR